MKKLISSMIFFILLSTCVFADSIPWRQYMSEPNNQSGWGGYCGMFAAVHCMEALYNYYYELGSSKLELDVAYFADPDSGMAAGECGTAIQNIINNGVRPELGSESFPNFTQAWYSVKSYGSLSTVQQIKDRIDDFGPVCIRMKWGSDVDEQAQAIAAYGTPGYTDPVYHSGQGIDYHWVVVVGYGSSPCNYFECLNSFSTGDDNYFKIQTDNFGSWCTDIKYLWIHNSSSDNETASEDTERSTLNEWCAPKIYPYMIPYFENFYSGGGYSQDPMNFKNDHEEMYIVGDVEADAITTIDDDITRILNLRREYSNDIDNDLIVTGSLSLTDCQIRPTGSGYFDGVVKVDNGTLNLTNVLISDLDRGIYVVGSNSAVDANYMTITNTTRGIYLGADGDCTIDNSNIGLYYNDIDYERLVQGYFGSMFTLGNNNISWDEENPSVWNEWETIDTSDNWWYNDETYGYLDVFLVYAHADVWEGREHALITGIGYDSPKIAAPSPYEMARIYESAQDWNNARNSYLQAIAQSDDSMKNKQALKGLLRVYKNQKWQSDDLRVIAHNEYEKALNKHKPTFDFIYNETYVAEEDYFTAIEMFEKCAQKYAGTSAEVRMLSRIANIYGDYLDDPATAKRYADRAAALNPGQQILLSAYWSAGIEYEPTDFTNKFEGVWEYYNVSDEHDADLAAESDVTVSPNPFNPSTVIGYTLTSPLRVELSIYSITGQKVATLVNGHVPAGRHSVTFDGANLASGIYFYRFESEALNKSGKLMLMK